MASIAQKKHSVPLARHRTTRELLDEALLSADLQLAWRATQLKDASHPDAAANPWADQKLLAALDGLESAAAAEDREGAAAHGRHQALGYLERMAAAEGRSAAAAHAYERALRKLVTEREEEEAPPAYMPSSDEPETAELAPLVPTTPQLAHSPDVPALAFRGAASHTFERAEDRWAREVERAHADKLRLMSLLELERTRLRESQRSFADEHEADRVRRAKAVSEAKRLADARVQAVTESSRAEISSLEERLAHAEAVSGERREECNRLQGEMAALHRTIARLEDKQKADAKLATEQEAELSRTHTRLEGEPYHVPA